MIHKGEIWTADLNPTVGQEMKKMRPVLILGKHPSSKREIYVIVPITGWKEEYNQAYWMRKIESIEETGLTKTSAADAGQVRAISTMRLIGKQGVATDVVNKAVAAVSYMLKTSK